MFENNNNDLESKGLFTFYRQQAQIQDRIVKQKRREKEYQQNRKNDKNRKLKPQRQNKTYEKLKDKQLSENIKKQRNEQEMMRVKKKSFVKINKERVKNLGRQNDNGLSGKFGNSVVVILQGQKSRGNEKLLGKNQAKSSQGYYIKERNISFLQSIQKQNEVNNGQNTLNEISNSQEIQQLSVQEEVGRNGHLWKDQGDEKNGKTSDQSGDTICSKQIRRNLSLNDVYLRENKRLEGEIVFNEQQRRARDWKLKGKMRVEKKRSQVQKDEEQMQILKQRQSEREIKKIDEDQQQSINIRQGSSLQKQKKKLYQWISKGKQYENINKVNIFQEAKLFTDPTRNIYRNQSPRYQPKNLNLNNFNSSIAIMLDNHSNHPVHDQNQSPQNLHKRNSLQLKFNKDKPKTVPRVLASILKSENYQMIRQLRKSLQKQRQQHKYTSFKNSFIDYNSFSNDQIQSKDYSLRQKDKTQRLNQRQKRLINILNKFNKKL